ncbi:F0F1 ATP synthase subunit epsilon [Ferruginivarius sediminum]|uniref:F0F1 ATP synthase subunit epsilon n=1 Tax=Ferruginivarius sediminum TaxID=2661937 RepID=A0A369TCJ9_9PROT|nr:F0F1 ATP synthase subunit epsilon [Ferruginivarius sediminum]RDD62254.1 F0F1 ATP synthase subunit epsilon [Ferruginivarius sediminum]
MHLKVLLPTEVLVDEAVDKVIAEGLEGQFCLLPRHADYVALIVPGVVLYTLPGSGSGDDEMARERYLAVDEGVLVKRGDRVNLSLRDAVAGRDLDELRLIVEQRYRTLDEREKQARSALARLEAGVVRRFIELAER